MQPDSVANLSEPERAVFGNRKFYSVTLNMPNLNSASGSWVIRFAERGQARGAAVLAADFGRAYLPRDRLTPLASYDVPGQRVTEDSDTKRTTIWSLTERPAEIAAPAPLEPDLGATGTRADVTGTHPFTPLEPRPSQQSLP